VRRGRLTPASGADAMSIQKTVTATDGSGREQSPSGGRSLRNSAPGLGLSGASVFTLVP
jgi:hypothetical protein